MDLALDGKAALVTGGASGIGLACVEVLAREGARALSLDRSAAADLRADVTDEGQVRSAVEAAVRALGGLDILVCCAGISGPVGSLAPAVSAGDWDAVMAVNAKGSFLVAKHAAPHLAQAASPAIVLLASDSALVAAEGMAPYCSSKGAVLMLTKALAVDLAPQNVRVNCVLTRRCSGFGQRSRSCRGGPRSDLGEVALRRVHRYETGDA